MNNSKGYSDITLNLFGGLDTELAPRTMPEGASPLNQDVDYIPGAVFTRAGLSSVYTYETIPTVLQNFNYIKTYAETDGSISTLALDASGTIWEESVTGNPGVLTSLYTGILAGSFAQSVTAEDREYIALSNLTNGTDIPRQISNQGWIDRVSQVGPGEAPVVTTVAGGNHLLATNGIVQNAAINYTSLESYYQIVLSSAQVSTTSPGSILTFYLRNGYTLPAYFQPGSNIVISNMPVIAGVNLNNSVGSNPAYYTLIGTVGAPPGTAGVGAASYQAFSVIVPYNAYLNATVGPTTPPGPFPVIGHLTFQATIATATTTTQVPNLQVGNQFSISGTSVSGYDLTWNVISTPNADQLNITSTSLTSNLATYTYTIVTGSAPVPGQFIDIVGTLNGSGIFNVASAVIQSVTIITPTTGSFAIAITSPNVPPASELGAYGIIFGTIFTFDPLSILGNSNGGILTVAGLIGAGTRQVCYSYLTRNGYVSQPSPVAMADITTGASGIAVANILPGPSNTIARIVSFTGANGAFFFNIPEPVTVVNNGVSTIETSTWINDNTTTTATFSFSDATLLAADSIDSQGNNWFEQKELGSCVGFINYAGRLFAIQEQNKVTNFLNMSFDGGVATSPSAQKYPAGWTIDPTNGAGGSVTTSTIFGNAYSIINSSGMTQALYGMITQDAFEDEDNVPIIQPNTTYSVRLTASSPNLSNVGNLMVDLYQPSSTAILGSFTLGLSNLSESMNIFTGTLLTVPITPAALPVPPPAPGPPFYAAGLVQHAGIGVAVQSGQASVQFFYPNPVTAGNTLVVAFDAFNYPAPPVVTDNNGNTWVQAVHQNTVGQEHNSYIYYVSGAVGGITTVSITQATWNFNSFITAVFAELDGILAPVSLDGTSSAFDTGNTGTVTTVNPNDVIVTGLSNGPTIPTGYSEIDTVEIVAAGGDQQYSAAYKVVSTTGTYTPDWVGSPNGTGVTAVFKLAQQNAPAPVVIPTTIPPNLLLRVYASTIPDGTQILMDRVEVFPTQQPVLTTQLTASYADNLEAFDQVTGVVDASITNQQPITNAFTIFDKLYILKSNSLFSTQDNGTTEPNDWGVKEDSTRIGCCGINAIDYGEEWCVWAHRTGLYVFFGGEPRKISQEIQSLWDKINWAYGNTIWVKNDISQRRITIGVPMITPNTWLPNAPANPNPTSPNIILMMNYREVNTVQDLAVESPIHVTYANRMVAKDLARKWSIWNITSPYGDFIERPDGTAPIFLCNGVINSKIYQLLESPAQGGTQTSDDGLPINWLYATYGFVKQDSAQGLNIGQQRKDFHKLSMAIEGAGTCNIMCLPDQLNSLYADNIGDLPLVYPSTDNTEVYLNEVGTRLFLQFSGNAVGAWFSLQELTMTLSKHPWSPDSGMDFWAPGGTP